MLRSPLVAGKSPRSPAGVEVSSGALTPLVLGVAHAERFAVGDDAGVVQESRMLAAVVFSSRNRPH